MALIKCPECGKQISDKALTCPACGCPIASKPKGVKLRCISDDKSARGYNIICIPEVKYVPMGTVATFNISSPQKITATVKFAITTGRSTSFNAVPGKCYEIRFCKTGIVWWDVVVSEVSFIS